MECLILNLCTGLIKGLILLLFIRLCSFMTNLLIFELCIELILDLFFGIIKCLRIESNGIRLIILFIICALFMICEYFFRTRKIDIRNKHVVVTGGSSGIGKCIAILAAKKGANITIIARNLANLEEAKQQILEACVNNDTQRVECLSLDIGVDYKTVEKALLDLEKNMGPIYMLVNSAGLAIAGKIENTKVEDLDSMVRTNFLGTYYCIKAVTPRMKASKEGVIVLMSSSVGLSGIFGYTACSSTKFALRGLAESLAMELQPYNISVTLCLPPDTNTPGHAIEEESKPLELKARSQGVKLVQPEIVAKKVFEDALKRNFFSTVGLEGFIMMTLCAGMAPVRLFCQLVVQVLLMGPLRIIGVISLFFDQKLIAKQARQES